ncbi:Tyrosine-specific transport protein [Spatholobus suberectus]|nr:Tyrosine-specific transport protein [Spatholobus suberectus]
MDSRCITSSPFLHLRLQIQRNAKANQSWARNPHRNTTTRTTTTTVFKMSKNYHNCLCYLHWQQQKPVIRRKPYARKAQKFSTELSKKTSKVAEKKEGTVAGAVALIIGTSIGTGILALPKKAFPAGIIPSSISVIVCWIFLLIEAFLLVEINVCLMRKKGKKEEDHELDVISIRTMAQETLGDWGGTIATIGYVFLGYSSMVAYSSKSGEILFQLINLPAPVSGSLFTALFTMLVSIWGTRTTDQVNQYLTASMIGLLLAIEVIAVVFGGWSGVGGISDWTKIPPTIPVIIFSLVFHDLTPFLCAYLEGDLRRIKTSVFLGALVPLVAVLVWDAVALGLAAEAEQVVDPVELLYRLKCNGVSIMVAAFSLLAVGASLIGTLLAFSEFFKEQLKNSTWISPPTEKIKGNWWGRNKINVTAVTMAVAPSLFVSTTFPDAFSSATDIAGGYCMTVLYGVLPPAMAWAMHKREPKLYGQKEFLNANAALVVAELFACGIVVEHILQDILALHS